MSAAIPGGYFLIQQNSPGDECSRAGTIPKSAVPKLTSMNVNDEAHSLRGANGDRQRAATCDHRTPMVDVTPLCNAFVGRPGKADLRMRCKAMLPGKS